MKILRKRIRNNCPIKGTFVKEQDSSILKEKQFFVIENLARLMIKEAKTIDMPLKLKEILALIYEDKKNECH